MSGPREIFWDGLGLSVPGQWEPARVGLGYLRFEDAAGPRLTLRWQALRPGATPEKALRRLTRRGVLAREERPSGALEATLKALGEGAWACRTGAGKGPDAAFFSPPGSGLAVLAALHPREGEPARPWIEAVGSLHGAPPGRFSLYDVAGEAPGGFRLAAFALKLGHYHFSFRGRGDTLDFFRFAPAEAILREASLEEWAGRTLAQGLGRSGVFRPALLEGSPSAVWDAPPTRGWWAPVRPALARVFDQARYAGAVAWRPDRSRILAVTARCRREVDPESLQEVCRRYVVLEA